MAYAILLHVAGQTTEVTNRRKPRPRKRLGPPPKAGTLVVYVLLSETDTPLYVGSTTNLLRRLVAHSQTQPWWAKAKHVAWHPVDRNAHRFDCERWVIGCVGPKYNHMSLVDQSIAGELVEAQRDRWRGMLRGPAHMHLDRWIFALRDRRVVTRRFAL